MRKWLYCKRDDVVSRRGFDIKQFHSGEGETDWEQRYQGKSASMDDPAWEKQKQAKADVIAALAPWMSERFPAPGRTRVLELACGFAGVGLELLDRGYDVHLSDYSPALVRELLAPRLKALGRDPSRAFVADVTDLSAFAPGKGGGEGYDVVLSSGLYGFSDMDRMRLAYREIKSLLKPGGYFLHWTDNFRNGYVDMLTRPVIRQAVNLKYALQGAVGGGALLLKAHPLLRKITGRPSVARLYVEPMFYGWMLTPEQMTDMLHKAGFTVLGTGYLDAAEGRRSLGQDFVWLARAWERFKVRDEGRMWGRRLLMYAHA